MEVVEPNLLRLFRNGQAMRWTQSLAMILTGIFYDLFSIPQGGGILYVLMSVDLLLLEAPLRQDRRSSRPHSYSSSYMQQLEVTTLRHPLLSSMCIIYRDSESRVVVARIIVFRPGRELFVGSHKRTSYIVRHEVRLRIDVQ